MASEIVLILGPITIAVILVAIYLAAPRFGPHLTSRLTCPKCGKTFDYDWLPGGSFSAIRLGTKRYMRCQLCGKWSLFEIVNSLVPPEKDDETKTSEDN